MTQDPNADDLLPCPFCGSDEVSFGISLIGPKDGPTVECHQVECFECEATSYSSKNQKLAAAAWNRRALKGEASEPTNLPILFDAYGVAASGCAICADLKFKGITTHPHYAIHRGEAPGIVGEGKEGPVATLPDAARDEALRLLGGLPARSAPKGTDLPVATGSREALNVLYDELIKMDTFSQSLMPQWVMKRLEPIIAALHPQPRPMTWTKEKPKVEGWYFCRHPDNPLSQAVALFKIINGHSKTYYAYRDKWRTTHKDMEFSGPIPEPKEPRAEEKE